MRVCLQIDTGCVFYFFFSSRRRHTRFKCDWSSDVCSSDLGWLEVRPVGKSGPYVYWRWRRPGERKIQTEYYGRADRLLEDLAVGAAVSRASRSEERRVGKECRSRWSPYH